MMDKVAVHVRLAGLTQDQRLRILQAARAVKDAKCDKQKRRRADRDLRQVLAYYAACGVLTPEEEAGIYYTFAVAGI